MTAIPNQHWGGENHTSVSRFVTSIVDKSTTLATPLCKNASYAPEVHIRFAAYRRATGQPSNRKLKRPTENRLLTWSLRAAGLREKLINIALIGRAQKLDYNFKSWVPFLPTTCTPVVSTRPASGKRNNFAMISMEILISSLINISSSMLPLFSDSELFLRSTSLIRSHIQSAEPTTQGLFTYKTTGRFLALTAQDWS